MFRYLIFLLLMVGSADRSFSQITIAGTDTILKKNGDEILGKILEVNPSFIVVQQNDSTSASNLIVLKADIFMIKFANGTRELITEHHAGHDSLSPYEMYSRGIRDGKRFYGGNGALFGTLGATLCPVYPVVDGVVVGVIIASVPPKIKVDDLPDPRLYDDKNYMNGFKKGVQNKKISKVTTGFVIGASLWACALLAVALTFQQVF